MGLFTYKTTALAPWKLHTGMGMHLHLHTHNRHYTQRHTHRSHLCPTHTITRKAFSRIHTTALHSPSKKWQLYKYHIQPLSLPLNTCCYSFHYRWDLLLIDRQRLYSIKFRFLKIFLLLLGSLISGHSRRGWFSYPHFHSMLYSDMCKIHYSFHISIITSLCVWAKRLVFLAEMDIL